MTNPQGVIRALSDLDAVLERFARDVQQNMSSADTFINGAQHAIDQCRIELEHNLSRARSELSRCRQSGYVDQNGRYFAPNCGREEAIVGELEERLAQLRYLADTFERVSRAYHSDAARMRSLVSSTLPAARSFVGDRQNALKQFEVSGGLGSLAAAAGASIVGLAAAVQKSGGHRYPYQKARQQFLRTLADDASQPRHVRGWVKQEINRLETQRAAGAHGLRPPGGSVNRLRGVPGYDVGHRFPGVDDPATFRLENASGNRARPGIARRLGLDDRFR